MKKSFETLFDPVEQRSEETWVGNVMKKIWSDISKVSAEKVAFVVTICEFMLNPQIESIRFDDEYLSAKLEENRVSIRNIIK